MFNGSLMNDAIFKFKRYEDSSLCYTGIDKHAGEDVGGWDTVIKRSEYDALFYNQQASLVVSTPQEFDIPVMSYTLETDEEQDESPEVKPEKKHVSHYPEKIAVKPVAVPVITKPVAPPPAPVIPKVEKLKIDTSGVKIGSVLMHKKFGPRHGDFVGQYIHDCNLCGGRKAFSVPGCNRKWILYHCLIHSQEK